MLKQMQGAVVAACVAVMLGAAPSSAEKVPEARLKEFASVMPAAPAGFKRNEAMGFYSSDSASSATATYKSDDGKSSFSIVITFSKANAKQNADMMQNASQLKTWGFEVVKVKGRDALARRADNKNKFAAILLVVLGERIVSATDSSGTADPAVVKAVFESVDFDAVAKK